MQRLGKRRYTNTRPGRHRNPQEGGDRHGIRRMDDDDALLFQL